MTNVAILIALFSTSPNMTKAKCELTTEVLIDQAIHDKQVSGKCHYEDDIKQAKTFFKKCWSNRGK